MKETLRIKTKIERSIRDSKLYELATQSIIYRESVLRIDELIAGVVRRMPVKSTRAGDRHVLVAPTGGGNIGDQALVEAFLKSVSGPITILVSSDCSIDVPDEDVSRVCTLSLKNFVYFPPILRIFPAFRLALVLRQARSVSVLGADLMDGLYNVAASLSRISVLNMGARLSKTSVLIGCSWSDNAMRSSVIGLRRADNAGAVINARDPLSLERMQRDGISGAQLTADIVFALDGSHAPTDLSAWIDKKVGAHSKLAVVNMSGLIGKRMNQIPEYRVIVDELLHQGYSVMMLPHVFRATGDDLDQCRLLVREISDTRLGLIDRQLSPREVRWLVGRADIVVTGRMHLAVMSLSQKTVAITLGTHGKVEGLYQYFPGLRGYVEPNPGFGELVARATHLVAADETNWDDDLKRVNSLALRNVETLI